MPCPATGCSEMEEVTWSCNKCKSVVEYGFDENKLFCSCGSSHLSSATFECGQHGNFLSPVPDKLVAAVRALVPYQEVNILILGETGVGKSSYINMFANLVTYKDIDDALDGGPITLISNKFSLTDDQLNTTMINNGQASKDEDTSVGVSCTQYCKVYRLVIGDKVIRLIDTPGIGDTRGILSDEENMNHVLDTLSTLDHLNGIIILLKPNDSRLGIVMRLDLQLD